MTNNINTRELFCYICGQSDHLCHWCKDCDKMNIPYAICYECGDRGPKFDESMKKFKDLLDSR
jgi:hypothetical protein